MTVYVCLEPDFLTVYVCLESDFLTVYVCLKTEFFRVYVCLETDFLTVYVCLETGGFDSVCMFSLEVSPENKGPPSMMSCQGQSFTHLSTVIPAPFFRTVYK